MSRVPGYADFTEFAEDYHDNEDLGLTLALRMGVAQWNYWLEHPAIELWELLETADPNNPRGYELLKLLREAKAESEQEGERG